jgi:hypothetical protein
VVLARELRNVPIQDSIADQYERLNERDSFD